MQKIMVIEDETNIRLSIIEILEIHNYSVISAENGAMALPIILSEKPDLILCDVMMPIMDGFTLVQNLQKEKGFDIPFIFLTAKAQIEDQKAGLTLGAHDYIIKPFKFSDLLTAIEKRFSKQAIYKQQLKVKTKLLDKLVKMISVSQNANTPINSMISLTSFIKDHVEKMNSQELEEYTQLVSEHSEKLQPIFEKLDSDNTYLHWLNLTDKQHPIADTHQLINIISKQVFENQGRLSDLFFNEMDEQSSFISQGIFGLILESCLMKVLKLTLPGDPITITSKSSQNKFLISIQFNANQLSAEQLIVLSELNNQNAGYTKPKTEESIIEFSNHLLHLFGGGNKI